MPSDYPPALQRYLEDLDEDAPEPWQLAFLRTARFVGRPSVETYRRLHAALMTVRPATERPSAGSTRGGLYPSSSTSKPRA